MIVVQSGVWWGEWRDKRDEEEVVEMGGTEGGMERWRGGGRNGWRDGGKEGEKCHSISLYDTPPGLF